MNHALLATFVDRAASRIGGTRMGSARWLRPLLVIPLHSRRGTKYLVATLGTPGPFCHLAAADPLAGVDAAAVLEPARGHTIAGVGLLGGDRVVEITTAPPEGAGSGVTLEIHLYGSAGVAVLRRGERRLATVGPGRTGDDRKPRSAPVVDTPFYLLSNGTPASVRPSPDDDRAAAFRLGPFEDAVEAAAAVGEIVAAGARNLIVEARLKPLVRRLAGRRKLLEKLEGDLERAAGAPDLRREAETLAAYRSRIAPGARVVELPDLYREGGTVRLALDPSEKIQKQIDDRFRRASKLEKSEAHARRRVGEIEDEVASLEEHIRLARAERGLAGAMAAIARCPAAPARPASPKGTPAPTGPYRRFDLDETWFALVGRNNQENDELTFRTATPEDWWFHAHQVPGSHVVLKSRGPRGTPPGRILEQTASIAAHFSKARHSSLVPVIYTRRKYVRKPRGARPGQVVCEREKMVVVAPTLPEP